MSLKTRLRVAISLLMAAVVVGVSVLYTYGFLTNEFDRTRDTAASIAKQVQGSAAARLETLPTNGQSHERLKEEWTEALKTDDRIHRMLKRSLENWNLVVEVYLTDPSGLVLASSTPAHDGTLRKPLPDISRWKSQSVVRNTWDVAFAGDDLEQSQPMAIQGENTPFFIAHVVLSMPVLRNVLLRPLKHLIAVFVLTLITAIALAVLLPNLVLNPLEQLSERLDLMATGKFSASDKEPAKRASKEFAAVYSKLDTLGQQFLGARENVDDLRTNVEQLLERLEQAVLLVDPAGRLIMAGKNAGKMLGVNAGLDGSATPQQLTELIPRDSELGLLLAEVTQTREPVSDRLITVESPEGIRNLSVTCEPLLRSPEKRPIGTLVTLRDPVMRGQIEAELGVGARLAAISRLTRGVAHEIKNPLNAITLHLEILRRRLDDHSPEVDVIGREISRLDRVVKTFLDFNRPVELRLEPVGLHEIGSELARLVAPQAAARGIEVHTEALEPAFIQGDKDLLKQAVLNVIMNAIDAMSSGGSLTLSTRRENRCAELHIADTGSGIPEDLRDRVFSLYFSTKKQGSGIGLAIAYRFVQLHDGKLEFSSTLGKGTTFRFSFAEAVSVSRPSNLAISRSQTA